MRSQTCEEQMINSASPRKYRIAGPSYQDQAPDAQLLNCCGEGASRTGRFPAVDTGSCRVAPCRSASRTARTAMDCCSKSRRSKTIELRRLNEGKVDQHSGGFFQLQKTSPPHATADEDHNSCKRQSSRQVITIVHIWCGSEKLTVTQNLANQKQ